MASIYTTHSKFTSLLVITALVLLLHTLAQSFFAVASIASHLHRNYNQHEMSLGMFEPYSYLTVGTSCLIPSNSHLVGYWFAFDTLENSSIGALFSFHWALLHGSSRSIHHWFMQQLITIPLFNKNEYTASDNPQTGLVGCEYNIFFFPVSFTGEMTLISFWISNFWKRVFWQAIYITLRLYIFSLSLPLTHTFSRRNKMASSGSGFNYDDYPVIVGIDFGRWLYHHAPK